MKKTLMMVLYIIIGIVVIILAVALISKKDYTIRREIIINQPDSLVYDYLRIFKNHKEFNAWFLKDPDMKETSNNNDGQVGYILSYEGNKDLGSGEEELIGLEPHKKIDIELRFLKPFKSTSRTPFELENIGQNQTKVTWTMYGKMHYPMNFALLLLDMDKFLGKDVQKSLENLKTNLENNR